MQLQMPYEAYIAAGAAFNALRFWLRAESLNEIISEVDAARIFLTCEKRPFCAARILTMIEIPPEFPEAQIQIDDFIASLRQYDGVAPPSG